MTDKQIMIDGCDVNDLYSDQIACMNRYEVANLFIKTVERLVTKEQECEELRKQWDFSVAHKIILEKDYNAELNQLKAENDSLKSELMQKNCYLDADKEIIDQLKAECENWASLCKHADKQIDELETENEELKKSVLKQCPNCGEEYLNPKGAELYDENNQLKQALTEIKQLLEDALDTDKTNAEQSFDNFYKAIKLCEVLDE